MLFFVTSHRKPKEIVCGRLYKIPLDTTLKYTHSGGHAKGMSLQLRFQIQYAHLKIKKNTSKNR